MNKIKHEFEFNTTDLQNVSILAKQTNLLESTVQLLYARGQTTAAQIERFLSAGKHNFLPPSQLLGVNEFVNRLQVAKHNNHKVVIYGDYDADGICASAIMYKALKNYGIISSVYIPERSEGYGLSQENLEKIVATHMPDLIITVDCGISSHKEVDFILGIGIDIIVTDHHELPDILPNCLIINPKLSGQKYPYDNLCGAGVAFKLACALDQTHAYTLLDLAAIATVADSVPLLGENRDIVAAGLALIVSPNCRLAVKKLLGDSNNQINAQAIAYLLAPKINAAGRLGKAHLALELFLSEVEGQIITLADELIGLNIERQSLCGDIFEVAINLAASEYKKNIIMLKSECFSSGFSGIAAAKLCEMYSKPVIIFSEKDGALKGSARSPEQINIYQAILNAKQFVLEFGGHSQAAGVSVSLSNFDAFYKCVDDYLSKTYTPDAYKQTITVAGEVTKPINKRFVEEINMLEPFGVGNKMPLYYFSATSCAVRTLKANSPHIAIDSNVGDMVFFSGQKFSQLLQSSAQKYIVFEPAISMFKGKSYLKNYVRAIDTSFNIHSVSLKELFYYSLKSIDLQVENSAIINQAQNITTSNCQKIIDQSLNGYGTCFILNDINNYKLYKNLDNLENCLFSPSSTNCANTLLVCPALQDLSCYEKVVYLDTPLQMQCKLPKNSFINNSVCGYNYIGQITTQRQALLDIYFYIKQNPNFAAKSSIELYNAMQPPFNECEFIFALEVFCELNLIAFIGKSVKFIQGAKAELEESKLYSKIKQLKEGNLC